MHEWEREVSDSPVPWVADHIRRYVTSDGKRGHRWSGMNTLLLTTRGRKTGILRRTALIYGRDADPFIVVASNGGKAEHPAWYQNLLENPASTCRSVPRNLPHARIQPAARKESGSGR